MSESGGLLPPQPALARSVVDVLRSMILQGVLVPGEHLKEAEIADRLGVSRGPVREALSILATEGHIELRRHRGAFVSHLTSQDVNEVYTLRVALERLAAERAAQRITDEQLAAMDALIQKMEAIDGDYTPIEAAELSLAFHDIIYAAADHGRLERAWRSIRSHVALFLVRRNLARHDFGEVGHREHQELRDAFAAHDPAAAVALIETHLARPYGHLVNERSESPPAG